MTLLPFTLQWLEQQSLVNDPFSLLSAVPCVGACGVTRQAVAWGVHNVARCGLNCPASAIKHIEWVPNRHQRVIVRGRTQYFSPTHRLLVVDPAEMMSSMLVALPCGT